MNMATGLGKVLFTPMNGTAAPFPVSEAPTTSGADAAKAAGSGTPVRLSSSDLDRIAQAKDATKKADIRYKAVPTTRVGRAANFGSLFLQLGWEKVLSRGSNSTGLLSVQGHQRIVETLCRMRGAVLKLGQMLSIQDSNTVPAHVTALFARVRDQAFAMPKHQLRGALAKEFGDPKWETSILDAWKEVPVAAASIGEVHWAKLKSNPIPETSGEVAIKIQYPGVAQSINSDISNLRTLLRIGVMPPGMFVDQVLRELRSELMQECRYTLEAEKQIRYRELLASPTKSTPALAEFFHVPRVYSQYSTDQMLVSEYVRGVPIDHLSKPEANVPQDYRNYVTEQLLSLTLHELFVWRFMQTDPNFANFLFDSEQQRVHLLDFGAAREYPDSFVSDYLEVVAASAREDRETVIEKSIALGFLCGREQKEMLDAHVQSVFLLGLPFRHRDKLFNYAEENIPSKVQKLVPTMVKLRLRPPPMPAYSLHRRLSGTILLATRLKASIPSGKLFWDIYDAHRADLALSARAANASSQEPPA